MLTTIIINVLLFIVGFVIGFLYKTVRTEAKSVMPPCPPPLFQSHYNALKQIYVPNPSYSTDDLEFELKQVRILLSANLFNLALQSGIMRDSIYKEYGEEYKELRLKELSLVEKINKINKDNGVDK